MTIEILLNPTSAPCRAVVLVLEALEIPYEYKVIDLQKGDHKTPEFLKINPYHNIPAIKDGDFCLNESRAIMSYLANKYGKESNIYPGNDAEVRARIDQRLFFDAGVFYKAFADIVVSIDFK